MFIGEEMLEKVFLIVPTLEKNKLFNGMGGEYMRQATSILIEKCSLAQIPQEQHFHFVGKIFFFFREIIGIY